MAILPTSWRRRTAGVALVALTGAAFATGLDAPPPPPAAHPSSATPAPDPRAQAHAEFRRLFDAGDYAAAAEQARRTVELTEQRQPASGEDLQAALMNLGLAEQRAGDYVAAEASFRRVIELIEAAGRQASPRLARAYAGLGTTYHAARRFDLAASSLERAIALNRRADGLFNETQLPLLEKQADALTELGRGGEALLAHRYALRVVGRRHGERSLPFAHQLESLGRWYTRVRSYEAGRATLRQSAELVEALAGPNSSGLVGPLTGLADNARRWLTDPVIREVSSADEQRSSMFHEAVMPTPPSLSPNTIAVEGLRALERAAALVDAAPDVSPTVTAGVHAQLGDWHQARRLPERARPSYQRAWAAAGAAPEGARLQQALFGAPTLIRYVLPDGWDRYARRPPEEIERRDVELRVTVTADGDARDPQVVAGGGDERLVSQTLRAVETARYRPRMVDGEPVQTDGVRFVQPFYVLRAPPAGARPAGPAEAPAAEKPPAEAPATAPPPQPPAQGGG